MAADATHDLSQLRDAERLIVRLRWLAMASWAPILLASDLPLGWRPAWAAYGVAVDAGAPAKSSADSAAVTATVASVSVIPKRIEVASVVR